MSDHGFITAWSGVRTGREQQALELWLEAATFFGKAEADGRIAAAEATLFMPSGGAMPNGMIAMWGTPEQIDAIRRDPDRLRIQAKALTLLDGLTETAAVRGGALDEMMGLFGEVTQELGAASS